MVEFTAVECAAVKFTVMEYTWSCFLSILAVLKEVPMKNMGVSKRNTKLYSFKPQVHKQ